MTNSTNWLDAYLNVTIKQEKHGAAGIMEQEDADSSDVVFRDQSRFWVQYVLVPIVLIVGVMGNSVTIYILTRKSMRSSTNVYLTALAVSDLFYLLFSFSMSWRHFPSINTFWFYWRYTPVGLWLTDASSSTSIWLTVSFTVERYIAVCHPTSGKIWDGEKRALFVAISVYILCFALTATTAFEWEAVVTSNQTELFHKSSYALERTEFGKDATYRIIYHWFTTVFFVILPLVILAILNFFLIQVVRKSRLARRHMATVDLRRAISVRQLQRMRQENRITVTLIAVVILFLLCQLPTAIVLIYTSSISLPSPGSVKENILLGLGNIFNLLVALNAASNFILYTALSGKYRKYFCDFFSFKKEIPTHMERRRKNIYVMRRFHARN